jgi:hypothetical protein
MPIVATPFCSKAGNACSQVPARRRRRLEKNAKLEEPPVEIGGMRMPQQFLIICSDIRHVVSDSQKFRTGEKMTALSISGEQNGLHVTVYPGDNKILVAMSLDDALLDEQDKNLAGFAI